ncbi:hypothetical protein BGC_36260 [Burkholderia sp. 3C]
MAIVEPTPATVVPRLDTTLLVLATTVPRALTELVPELVPELLPDEDEEDDEPLVEPLDEPLVLPDDDPEVPDELDVPLVPDEPLVPEEPLVPDDPLVPDEPLVPEVVCGVLLSEPPVPWLNEPEPPQAERESMAATVAAIKVVRNVP